VGGLGKSWFPPQSAEGNYSFPVLWDSVIGGVDLAKVNSVPGVKERGQQIDHSRPILGCEKTLNIFKNKSVGSQLGYRVGEVCDKVVASITTASHARRRESLTRRPSHHNVCLGNPHI
jgi:hypothetical protein